jgi:hypothetical protein
MPEIRTYKMWNNLHIGFKCVKCEEPTFFSKHKDFSTGIDIITLKCPCGGKMYIWCGHKEPKQKYLGELDKWMKKDLKK